MLVRPPCSHRFGPRVPVPGNVLLSRRASGLPKDSVANVSQIIAVDRALSRNMSPVYQAESYKSAGRHRRRARSIEIETSRCARRQHLELREPVQHHDQLGAFVTAFDHDEPLAIRGDVIVAVAGIDREARGIEERLAPENREPIRGIDLRGDQQLVFVPVKELLAVP